MSATPVVRVEGEGIKRWFYGGGTHTWKVTNEDTDGAFFMFEDVMEQGKMTPLHKHPKNDELTYLLEGEILSRIDGVEHKLGAGSVTFVPRGVEHAFVVLSPVAKLVTVQNPGDSQAFYWNASEAATNDGPGPVDFARIGQVAQETGQTEILGPPPFPHP